jgi:hypothetical protein
MRFDVRCGGCGRVLQRVRLAAGHTAAEMIAAYEAEAAKDRQTIRCRCGRVTGFGPTRDCPRRGVRCHEALAVLRGAGDSVARTGPMAALGRLHAEHVRRGGRYDPPAPRKPRKPRKRSAPPGTVRIGTEDGEIVVPPGQVARVAGLVVDTTGGRVRVVPSAPAPTMHA